MQRMGRRTTFNRREFVMAFAVAAAGLAVACGNQENLGPAGSGSGSSNAGDGTASPTAPPAASPAAPASPVAAIAHPTGADELILRLDVTGGFMPVSYVVTQLPAFSLYGDGRVIAPGPQIAIFPAPALPSVQVTRLTEDGIQAVLRAAEEASLLDGNESWDQAPVADAPFTIVTANANGTTSVTSIYALGIDIPIEGVTPAEKVAREKLTAFQARITNLRGFLPGGSVAAEDEPYMFDRLQIVVQPAEKPADATPTAGDSAATSPTTDDPAGSPTTKPWPLTAPLAQFGQPYTLQGSRCGVIEGADLQPLLDAAADANQLTLWESDGQFYNAYLRPLLPDEQGCQTQAR